MRRRFRFLAATAVCLGASSSYGFGSQWLNINLFRAIQFSGRRALGYHSETVSGDGDSYRTLTDYGQGGKTITDTGSVSVLGRNVLGVLNFQMTLQNNRFGDPQGERVSLNYHKSGVTIDAGDIQGSLLNTNQYASFGKSLKGLMGGYEHGRFAAKGLTSTVNGTVQTASLQGNGGIGPYYIGATRIVQDSEKVLLDGAQQKVGTDYTINDDTGAITFFKPVSQTSTITVSYEAYNVNSSAGTLTGLGASYDMGRFGKFGLTQISQTQPGGPGATSKIDLFQGYGAPGTPYTLTYLPLATAPIIVKVDGLVQTLGVDYYFDSGNPAIFYFTRFIPNTSTVEVDYTPKPTASAQGNRRVTGFDYGLPIKLGKNSTGSLSYSQATGSLTNTTVPTSGTAKSIGAELSMGTTKFHATVQDVPEGYVGIQTASFNRNEKGIDYGVESAWKRLTFGATGSNNVVSSFSDNSDGSRTYSFSRVTSTDLFTRWIRGSETVKLEQNRTTQTGDSGTSRLYKTTLDDSRKLDRLTYGLGLSHIVGRGPISLDGTTTQGEVSADSLSAHFDYAWGKGFSTGFTSSLSQSKTGDQSGRGTDFGLTSGFHPNGPLSLDFSYSLSHAGELAALSSFSTGLGYSGSSGFSQSANTMSGGATNLRLVSLVSAYRLNRRMNFDLHGTQSDAAGASSSNSKTQTFGGGVRIDLGHTNNGYFGMEQTTSDFSDSLNHSASKTFDVRLSGAPLKRWSYAIGFNSLISSASAYSQDRFATDLTLSRRISVLESLSLNVTDGHTSYYQPQSDGGVVMSYLRSLYKNLDFVASYRWRHLTNLNTDQTVGSYRAKGLNLQLTFDFNH